LLVAVSLPGALIQRCNHRGFACDMNMWAAVNSGSGWRCTTCDIGRDVCLQCLQAPTDWTWGPQARERES
jgi:hypothetical protein